MVFQKKTSKHLVVCVKSYTFALAFAQTGETQAILEKIT
jgi:hypothetical protein